MLEGLNCIEYVFSETMIYTTYILGFYLTTGLCLFVLCRNDSVAICSCLDVQSASYAHSLFSIVSSLVWLCSMSVPSTELVSSCIKNSWDKKSCSVWSAPWIFNEKMRKEWGLKLLIKYICLSRINYFTIFWFCLVSNFIFSQWSQHNLEAF